MKKIALKDEIIVRYLGLALRSRIQHTSKMISLSAIDKTHLRVFCILRGCIFKRIMSETYKRYFCFFFKRFGQYLKNVTAGCQYRMSLILRKKKTLCSLNLQRIFHNHCVIKFHTAGFKIISFFRAEFLTNLNLEPHNQPEIKLALNFWSCDSYIKVESRLYDRPL